MVSRVRRGSRLRAVCCGLVTAAALVAGCARVVTGVAQAGDPQSRGGLPVQVADLLLEPTRFPPGYPAAVVPPKDLDRVLGEIDGVAVGSEVTPPDCAPLPVLTDQRAAVQGTDEAGARLTVTVIRPVPSVRSRIAQLADCPSFTSTAGAGSGDVSKVTVDLPPAPPVDADDSYAVDQTVSSTSSARQNSRTLTLVALVSDVRVSASWQQHGESDDSPDTQALDVLFTNAVLKVRKEIPR